MTATELQIRMAGQAVLPIARGATNLDNGYVLLGGDRHTPFFCFPERFASLDIAWPRPACSYFDAGADAGHQYIMLDIGGCTLEVDPPSEGNRGEAYLPGAVSMGSLAETIDLADFVGSNVIKLKDVQAAARRAGARVNLRVGEVGQGALSVFKASSPSVPNWAARSVASELRWKLPERASHVVYLHTGLQRHRLTLTNPPGGEPLVCYLTSFCGWTGDQSKTTIDFDAGRSLFPGLASEGKFPFPEDLAFNDLQVHPGKPQCDPIKVTFV